MCVTSQQPRQWIIGVNLKNDRYRRICKINLKNLEKTIINPKLHTSFLCDRQTETPNWNYNRGKSQTTRELRERDTQRGAKLRKKPDFSSTFYFYSDSGSGDLQLSGSQNIHSHGIEFQA